MKKLKFVKRSPPSQQMSLKIAFSGHMGSGKSTATQYLISKHGGREIAFAGPIYDILWYAQQRCGLPQEKDRKFLQFIGTEWGRNKDPDLWIRATLSEVTEGNVYLSDLRFENEMRALVEDGWVCVRLIRTVPDGREGTGARQHVSESSLDHVPVADWDFVIHNEGSLPDFRTKLDALVRKLQIKKCC